MTVIAIFICSFVIVTYLSTDFLVKYVCGCRLGTTHVHSIIICTNFFTIETHPKCILDTNGHDDPWIPESELKKSGALIINRNYGDVIEDTQKQLRYLPKDYKIEPIEYKFNVQNAFGQEREYTIYYAIIPPM